MIRIIGLKKQIIGFKVKTLSELGFIGLEKRLLGLKNLI
jgi:hypothetical protein